MPSRGMARLGSSGGATLQRSKLDLKQETKTMEPKVDDGMGGGNNGKNIHNGGGGDNDGGDDDDYFDNFDGGDGEGDDGAFFRTVIEQLYDRRSINAVLQEWFRTLESLPAILRGSVEMGLFSSAQLVRFLSMDVRPGVARAVMRSLPPQVRAHRPLAASPQCLRDVAGTCRPRRASISSQLWRRWGCMHECLRRTGPPAHPPPLFVLAALDRSCGHC